MSVIVPLMWQGFSKAGRGLPLGAPEGETPTSQAVEKPPGSPEVEVLSSSSGGMSSMDAKAQVALGVINLRSRDGTSVPASSGDRDMVNLDRIKSMPRVLIGRATSMPVEETTIVTIEKCLAKRGSEPSKKKRKIVA
ncbi:hypothetical protein GW17_00061292 [Ensete ventricosum]|nr:hypothetical protein GW17_00061292 [Ensete ventricosum]